MSTCTRVSFAAGLLLIVGCTSAGPTGVSGLDEVLLRADDTPGRQGYLFVAMVESEVAAQYAAFARASGGDVGAIKSALGEVVYALDPNQAPGWRAKSAGLVSGWAGQGYGVRRASDRAAQALEAATASGSASASLREVAPRAARCLDNTSRRADRLLALTDQALGDQSVTQLSGLLPTIDSLARELNAGAAGATGATVAEACGLRDAVRDLRTVVPPQQSS